MALRFPLSRLVVALVGVVLALGSARAQGLDDGWTALEKKAREHRQLIPDLFRGKTAFDANEKSHAEAVDVQAKVVTYHPYLEHLEGQPGKIDRVFKEFEGDLTGIARGKPGTQPLADAYRDRIRAHALEVLQHKGTKPIHRIHAARVLARVAELGQGQLADTLRDVLKDPGQNDGVYYYVLRGLSDLLSLPPPMPNTPPVVSKEQKASCAEAIVAFLDRKPTLSAISSQEEIDGYRWLRREALRALSATQVPEVSPKVRPALVLARFAGNDSSIKPAPRIDERVEAAIGLARMQSAQSPQYQPDYAASQIGQCINAFGNQHNDQPADLAKRILPWKIYATRLSDALNALKADSGKNAYVTEVVSRGLRVLQPVTRGDKADPGQLVWFTTPASAPPSKELFRGAADSVVKPAEAAGEEAPEKPDKPEKPEKEKDKDKDKEKGKEKGTEKDKDKDKGKEKAKK
jgi:hypothetical protein